MNHKVTHFVFTDGWEPQDSEGNRVSLITGLEDGLVECVPLSSIHGFTCSPTCNTGDSSEVCLLNEWEGRKEARTQCKTVLSTVHNKIVFKRTRYVSAQLSISSNLQCLHNSSCSFKCYSIHCVCQTICDVTSSNVLRVGQGEVGWYIYPKGENSMAVCGFGRKNPSVGSVYKWCWKKVITPHRASMQCSSVI